jgi:type III pantothenate kinase
VKHYFFDLGNTRLKAWACDEAEAVLGSEAISHAGDPAAAIVELSAGFDAPPSFIGVASVLGDDVKRALSAACRTRWGQEARFAIGQPETAGVRCAYADYARLGIDRWLGVLAVADGEHDYCVVDCGTALTIDAVTRDRQHLGGYILPGLELLADALVSNTRQVRVTEAVADSLEWGRSTSEAVRNGAWLAASGAVEAAVKRLRQQTGRQPRLVLTGGDAARLAPRLTEPYRLAPELLLTGLQRYFSANGIK